MFTWTADWAGAETQRLSKRRDRAEEYFLRRPRAFSVCSKLQYIFYESVVESGILFAFTCCGSRIRANGSKNLDKLMKKTGTVPGTALQPLVLILLRRMLHKLLNTMHSKVQGIFNMTKNSNLNVFNHSCLLLE